MSGSSAKAQRRAHQETPPAGAPAVATAWLNYRGDLSGSLGEIMGPNLLGEGFVAIECDFDAATGMSRVGFARLQVRNG